MRAWAREADHLGARSRTPVHPEGARKSPMPSICGAADHTTPPSAYHNAVSPSRSCTPRGSSPRHRSGPSPGRLTNHYRDHLAGRRPGDGAAHGAHSAARTDLQRVRDLFRSFREQPTPEFVRLIAGLGACRQGQSFTCTCVTSFVRWTHPNRLAFQAVSCDLARKRFRRPAEQEQGGLPRWDTSTLGGYRLVMLCNFQCCQGPNLRPARRMTACHPRRPGARHIIRGRNTA